MIANVRLSRPAQIEVDFNEVTEDGLLRVRQSDASRPISQGQAVRILDPDDEIEGDATVARVNVRTGLAYLDVAWDSLRDLQGSAVEVSTATFVRKLLSFGTATPRLLNLSATVA